MVAVVAAERARSITRRLWRLSLRGAGVLVVVETWVQAGWVVWVAVLSRELSAVQVCLGYLGSRSPATRVVTALVVGRQ